MGVTVAAFSVTERRRGGKRERERGEEEVAVVVSRRWRRGRRGRESIEKERRSGGRVSWEKEY